MVPAAQENKVADMEHELNEAQRRVEVTQATFDQIVARMATDFARFQASPSLPLTPAPALPPALPAAPSLMVCMLSSCNRPETWKVWLHDIRNRARLCHYSVMGC